MSRMYLTANVERMSAWFLFGLFCVNYSVGPTSSEQTGSEQPLSHEAFFLDVPNQASVKPEVNANAGREMYSNAYQLQC